MSKTHHFKFQNEPLHRIKPKMNSQWHSKADHSKNRLQPNTNLGKECLSNSFNRFYTAIRRTRLSDAACKRHCGCKK